MKTAISIPDDVFLAADKLARDLGQSRSQLYARAVREYVAQHSADSITEALDSVCADIVPEANDFATTASRRILEGAEW